MTDKEWAAWAEQKYKHGYNDGKNDLRNELKQLLEIEEDIDRRIRFHVEDVHQKDPER